MRTREDYIDWLVAGKPLPEIDEAEIEMPEGIYICLSCGNVNSDHKTWCNNCDNKIDMAGL